VAASGSFEVRRLPEIGSACQQLRIRRKHSPPRVLALRLLRTRKLDDVLQAPVARSVDVAPEVRGEDDDAIVLFQILQEISCFDVDVPIVRVFDSSAAAENDFRLVQQQDRSGGADWRRDLGGPKQPSRSNSPAMRSAKSRPP
jgi:hypothetical protein